MEGEERRNVDRKKRGEEEIYKERGGGGKMNWNTWEERGKVEIERKLRKKEKI